MDDSSKSNILVVDGCPANRLAMVKLLSPLGATIHQAQSGEAALATALQHRFAVILLAVHLPDMDGFATATLLHSNKQTANIPIIFITAPNEAPVYVSKGYTTGAVDYLSQPINPPVLLGKVKLFLQLEQQGQALAEVTRKLDNLNQKNQLLLNCAGAGIIGVDTDGYITFVNPAASRLLADTETHLLGIHISQLFFNDDPKTALQRWQQAAVWEACFNQGSGSQQSGTMWQPSGGHFAAEYHIAALVDAQQQVQGAVLTFKDITERKALEEQLVRMAKYDSLTGLSNRDLFSEFLETSLARSQRRQKSSAVMFLDLDHFKDVNDTWGHDAGDTILVQVAQRLQACVRDGDLVARLGGDEFAIILDDVADPQDVQIVAERMLDSVRQPYSFEPRSDGHERHQANIGTSIGIAIYPEAGTTPNALIIAADQAMYVAKKEGRHGYRFYSDNMASANSRRFGQVTAVSSRKLIRSRSHKSDT